MLLGAYAGDQPGLPLWASMGFLVAGMIGVLITGLVILDERRRRATQAS